MFPLIGTEQLNLPFIINSLFFYPTKERNAIILFGRDENRYKPNQDKMVSLVQLFKRFVELVIKNNNEKCNNWKNLHLLAEIK